jgi:hypothetical protein
MRVETSRSDLLRPLLVVATLALWFVAAPSRAGAPANATLLATPTMLVAGNSLLLSATAPCTFFGGGGATCPYAFSLQGNALTTITGGDSATLSVPFSTFVALDLDAAFGPLSASVAVTTLGGPATATASFTLSPAAAVPSPGTLSLLALALVGLGLSLRRMGQHRLH